MVCVDVKARGKLIKEGRSAGRRITRDAVSMATWRESSDQRDRQFLGFVNLLSCSSPKVRKEKTYIFVRKL